MSDDAAFLNYGIEWRNKSLASWHRLECFERFGVAWSVAFFLLGAYWFHSPWWVQAMHVTTCAINMKLIRGNRRRQQELRNEIEAIRSHTMDWWN